MTTEGARPPHDHAPKDVPDRLHGTTLYDKDFYTWSFVQAKHLRAKNWAALDIDHLAEEIESLGNEQAHAVESHLVVVLMHLLKWQYQPQRRGRGWRTSIRVGRQQIARRLRRNPGLQPDLPTLLADAYVDARKRAMDDTGLPLVTFPETCPWPVAQVLAEDFFPAEAP